jgi:hypothetical protein
VFAVLFSNVQPVNVEPLLEPLATIPPPSEVTVLLMNVQPVSVNMLLILCIPPPSMAVLPVNVQSVSVGLLSSQ